MKKWSNKLSTPDTAGKEIQRRHKLSVNRRLRADKESFAARVEEETLREALGNLNIRALKTYTHERP